MSSGTFLVVAAVVLVVGALVAWRDRRARRRNRQGDTIAPHPRFAYREFEGRSSSQLMREGATVVRRDASGATGGESAPSRIDVERDATGTDAA